MVKTSLSVVLICLILVTLTSARSSTLFDLSDEQATGLELGERPSISSNQFETRLKELNDIEAEARGLLSYVLKSKQRLLNELGQGYRNKNMAVNGGDDFRKRAAYRNFSKGTYSDLLNMLLENG